MACYSPVRGVLFKAPDGRQRLSFSRSVVGKGVSLPCGYCIGCRLERARQWAVRIMHESKMHDENAFLTLTYDDEHLPEGGSLSVVDCQLFLKRLRERLAPKRIRFFLAGEYGEKLGRPHYHAIVFGWFPPDAVCVKRCGELSLYTSSMLSDAWGNGNTSVGMVSFDSACYVANYATKKITSNRGEEAKRLAGRRAEFLTMSRRPGIGRSWFEEFKADVFPSDECIVRGVSTRPPRYYSQTAESLGIDLSGVRAKREAEIDRLEEFVLASGERVEVSASRNARRLAVREKVARAKLALKRRSLEGE